MRKLHDKYVAIIALSVFFVLSQLTITSASENDAATDILVCINKKSGLMRKPKGVKCKSVETPLTVSMQGAQGLQGPQGLQGLQGLQGPPGIGFEFQFLQANGNDLPWPLWNTTSTNWNRWADYTVNFVFDLVNGRPRFISQNPLHADYTPSKAILYTDRTCSDPAFIMVSKTSLDRNYDDFKLNVLDSSVQYARYNSQPMYVSNVYRARVSPDEEKLYFLQVQRGSNLPRCHPAKWDLSQYYTHFIISELKSLPQVFFPLQLKPAG